MKKRHGFTLIEVLVVVSIIALLVSITLPAFAESRRISKKTVCLHNLHEIGLAIHAYLLTNHDTFPNVARFPTTEAANWSTLGHAYPHPPLPEAFKKESGGNGQVFLCPADLITKTDQVAPSGPSLVSLGSRYYDSQKTSYEWESQLNGLKLQYKTLKVVKELIDARLKDVWMVFDFEPFHGGPNRIGTHNVLYADLRVQSDQWNQWKVVGQ